MEDMASGWEKINRTEHTQPMTLGGARSKKQTRKLRDRLMGRFSHLALPATCTISFFVVGCSPVHCRMRSITGFLPLVASSTLY